MKTITPSEVRAVIRAAGPTEFVSVEFVKTDGTIRRIVGMRAPTSKITGSERGAAMGAAMEARGQIPIWEVESRKWKSFKADKARRIVTRGETYEVEA